jgi:ubiquinone/menaquinone biosynthesis C-methylase UbiE
MKDSPEFLFDEFKHIGVDFDDIQQVETFDVKQGTTLDKDNALLDRLKIQKSNSLIDFGCGTGSFACQAALRCNQVYAVDISSAMLNFAKRRALEHNVTNIEFHQAGFLTYEHQGQLVDYAVSKSALHHLPDFWKVAALQRICSILKPEGIFYLWDAVYSFEASRYNEEAQNWIETCGREDGKGFSKSEFAMHIREEFSTYNWLMEPILEKSGFEIVEKNYPRKTTAEYLCKKR